MARETHYGLGDGDRRRSVLELEVAVSLSAISLCTSLASAYLALEFKSYQLLLSPAPLGLLSTLFLLSTVGFFAAALYRSPWTVLGLATLSCLSLPSIFGFWVSPTLVVELSSETSSLVSDLQLGLVGLLLLVTCLLQLYRLKSPVRELSTIEGSAAWADYQDIKHAGLLSATGPYLGIHEEGRRRSYLRSEGSAHLMCVAPSRSGKGVGVVIPTLLSWNGSVVVLDPKSEAWHVTSRYRKERLGNICIRVDLTEEGEDFASYNPLLDIRPYPYDVQDAQLIADALVYGDGDLRGEDNHWNATGSSLIACCILHVLYAEPDKSLKRVFDILTSESVDATLQGMVDFDHSVVCGIKWRFEEIKHRTGVHPAIRRGLNDVLNKPDKERGSVVSTAVRALSVLGDPVLAKKLSSSSFSLSDLRGHESPVSLYLTMPDHQISRLAPIIRVFLSRAIATAVSQSPSESAEQAPTKSHKLLFLIDEFPTLGRMKLVEQALATTAAFGIRFMLVMQSLGQLHQRYGTFESITSNCNVQVFFRPNEPSTAQKLERRLGDVTTLDTSASTNRRRFSPIANSVNEATRYKSRKLLTADEIMRLEDNRCLVFSGSSRPVYAKKIRYYSDARFSEATNLPPLDSSDFIPRLYTWRSFRATKALSADGDPHNSPQERVLNVSELGSEEEGDIEVFYKL